MSQYSEFNELDEKTNFIIRMESKSKEKLIN